jgi:endoglucanase
MPDDPRLIPSVIALSLAFVTGCPDRPPPALAPFDAAPEATSPAPGTPTPAPGVATPAAPVPAYPTPALGEPPVPPPAGKGLAVPLQKYIVVDQFGYRPDMAKVAILVDPQRGWNAPDVYTPGSELEVRKWSDGVSVYKSKPGRWNGGALDERSGDRGSWFDFSALKLPGLYYVFDPTNNVRSYPFEIAPDVYKRVLKAAQKMFYFNRANFAKKPPHSCVGKRCWSLGIDNVGPGQDRQARSIRDRDNPKTARDLSGGWWDAGDTNKYVTFSNDVVHQLLTAYTEHPQAFSDDFGIPESGNGLPDLIDEILVELEWLKKMQPADLKGGGLIKLGYADFGDPVPDVSPLPRFYYPAPCSSATIVLAGQFAHAAVVLKQFPRVAGEVEKLGKRARDAWNFYHANPKSDACDDQTVKSGDADQPLKVQAQLSVVAAVYLFALTGEAGFDDYVKQHFGSLRPFEDDRWSVYDQSQGDALLYYAGLANADARTKSAILDRKKAEAGRVEIYKFRPELDLYRAYMRADSFHWGSNNARAGFGNTNYDVLVHGLAAPSERASFRDRAAGILGSFHGVNPMQLVYLTNMYADGGDACADELFHSWFRDGDPKWDNARVSEFGPAPGYVTGGPNKTYCSWQNPAENACANSAVREQPPGKAYLNSNTGFEPSNPYDKSWELTEPGIYYQASYVRLVSKFVD